MDHDRLKRLVGQAKAGERKLSVGRIVAESNGAYSVIVNGRAEPRSAVATNDFVFNRTGHGIGDEVLVVTSELNDQPVIVGHSPWLLNAEGTEYDG